MSLFRGAGGLLGGGNSSSQPTETPDNLSSKDLVEVVLGLCQGPIKGLTNGHKSFYIGDTQYQNDDGTYNFSLLSLEINPGHTPGEQIVPVLGGFEDWRPLTDVPLTFGDWKVITTPPGITMSQFILVIQVDKLYRDGTDAQLAALPGSPQIYSTFLPHTMELEVKYRPAGSEETYINPFGGPIQIIGKTQTGETHEVRIAIDIPGPIDVAVRNLTPQGGGLFVQAHLAGYYIVTGGFFGLSRSTTVNQQLFPGVQVVRQTQYPNQRQDGTFGIDYLCLRTVISQLYTANIHGTFNATLSLLIEYKASSSPTWINPFGAYQLIAGKTTTNVVWEHRWPVPAISDTYDIRVTRITPTNSEEFIQVSWESTQEIVGGPTKFDGVATAHFYGRSSDQFQSLPTFWGEYDLLLCKLPTNYDPYARTYSGTWDGTFKEDWTSNPAWCLYTMAMNTDFGARRYWPNYNLDKFDVYAAGQWCDQQVPDGRGGFQPRYTFNGLITEPRGMREQLRYMAGVFNGTLIDDLNGSVRLVYDHDEAAVALFTPENVFDGMFSYSYTDPSTRYNDITAHYNDPNLNYSTAPKRLWDQPDINRFGTVPLEYAAIGCTDGHEAVRRTAYKLITALTEREIVSYRTNRQGLLVQPFQPILIADPDMGYSITGRIAGVDSARQVVTLRDAVYLERGIRYIFRTHYPNPDPSVSPLAVVEIPFYAIDNGAAKAFQLSAPLPATVPLNAQFSLGAVGSTTGVPKPYKVTRVEEVDGNPDLIEIDAIEINRAKWQLADNAIDRNGIDFLNYPVDIAPPTSLVVESIGVDINGAILANVIATWVASADPRVLRYQMQYRKNGDTEWIRIAETGNTRADIYGVADGVYDFRVRAVSFSGTFSIWVERDAVQAGLTVPPDDVQNVGINLIGDKANLYWNAVKAKDLSYYRVRFTPIIGADASWVGSTDLISKVNGTSVQVGAQAGTYFVKAVNIMGIESVNAGFASTSVTPLGMNAVERIENFPTWPGDKFQMYIDEHGLLKQRLDLGDTGGYQWYSGDLGETFLCRLTVEMVVTAENVNFHMADWPTLTSVQTLSGVDADSYSTQMYVARSLDGVTFLPYEPFSTGDWYGRKFLFAVFLFSNKAGVRPILYRCASIVDMPDRTESGRSLFVPTYGYSVTFDPPFHATPSINVTAKDGQSGDYLVLTGENRTGFTMQFLDSSNTPVARIVDWAAFGYGGR